MAAEWLLSAFIIAVATPDSEPVWRQSHQAMQTISTSPELMLSHSGA
jgi:hypothetical protein